MNRPGRVGPQVAKRARLCRATGRRQARTGKPGESAARDQRGRRPGRGCGRRDRTPPAFLAGRAPRPRAAARPRPVRPRRRQAPSASAAAMPARASRRAPRAARAHAAPPGCLRSRSRHGSAPTVARRRRLRGSGADVYPRAPGSGRTSRDRCGGRPGRGRRASAASDSIWSLMMRPALLRCGSLRGRAGCGGLVWTVSTAPVAPRRAIGCCAGECRALDLVASVVSRENVFGTPPQPGGVCFLMIITHATSPVARGRLSSQSSTSV